MSEFGREMLRDDSSTLHGVDEGQAKVGGLVYAGNRRMRLVLDPKCPDNRLFRDIPDWDGESAVQIDRMLREYKRALGISRRDSESEFFNSVEIAS